MPENYYLKLAAMFIIPLIAVLIPIVIGYRHGVQRGKKTPELTETPIGTLVAAALGLLGFMLAFAFQIASNRFDKRKELLLEEVTNIRTAYLRAGLLPEPYRSGTQKSMIEYIDLRAIKVESQAELTQLMNRSQQILDTCWNYAEQLAAQDRSSEVYALYTSTINDLIDNYNQRITVALEYRIPLPVYVVLFIITFLTMVAFGYHYGLHGKGGLRISAILAIIFAVVIFLVLILDHPEMGIIKVNQKSVLKLQEQLHNMK